MRSVNVGEAKNQFSRLLAAVERGETVRICRDGVPIAELRAGPRVVNPLDAGLPRPCTHLDLAALQRPWPDGDAELGGDAWGIR